MTDTTRVCEVSGRMILLMKLLSCGRAPAEVFLQGSEYLTEGEFAWSMCNNMLLPSWIMPCVQPVLPDLLLICVFIFRVTSVEGPVGSDAGPSSKTMC